MDISQCIEILSNRQQCGHVDCMRCVSVPKPPPTQFSASSEIGTLTDMSPLELLNLVSVLQSERVQVDTLYLYFN